MAEISVEEAELANSEAEGKRISSHDKLRLGMMKRDLKAFLGNSENGESEDKATQEEEETFEQTLDRKYPGIPGSGKTMEAVG